MKKLVKLGMIGLGARGETLLATLFHFNRDEVVVSAICDIDPVRVERILDIMKKNDYPQPEVFSDFEKTQQIDAEYKELSTKLESLYEEWEEAGC